MPNDEQAIDMTIGGHLTMRDVAAVSDLSRVAVDFADISIRLGRIPCEMSAAITDVAEAVREARIDMQRPELVEAASDILSLAFRGAVRDGDLHQAELLELALEYVASAGRRILLIDRHDQLTQDTREIGP